MLHMYLKHFL